MSADVDLSGLEDVEARLRRVDALGAAIATEAAPHVLNAARKAAGAGVDPEGHAWAPKKKGGGRPLEHAAGAILILVSGTTNAVLTLVLRGYHVFQHYGRKKGKKGEGLPSRRILPDQDGEIPGAYVDEIRAAAGRVVARTMGGRA